jgi:beta-glucanase (GH16 family)
MRFAASSFKSVATAAFLIPFATLTSAFGQDFTEVWSDEFDGPTIDLQNWTFDVGGGGWGNNELQYYTDRPENARIEYDDNGNGYLVIEARPERYRNRRYTSARLKTQGLHSWTYGRIEARIRIPYGQGLWPAFWMLGDNFSSVGWPDCGEIDIMENIGREPYTVHGTLHGPGYSGADGVGGAYDTTTPIAEDFHVFKLEWEPEEIRWVMDSDQPFLTLTPSDVPGPWVFDHRFFIILNVAVGGYWPGEPDATTVWPQRMEVDYVRIYQSSVEPPPPAEGLLHVADIAMQHNSTGPLWQAMAAVTVQDDQNHAVAGATVNGVWSGLVSGGNTSFVTDTAGIAGPFYSRKTRASGTITFTVADIALEGWTYDPGSNTETWGSVSN